MKELLGYMSRHHENLEKSFSDEQKEIFKKFHDCWSEYMSLGEAAIFEYAFKLGARIMLSVASERGRTISYLAVCTKVPHGFSVIIASWSRIRAFFSFAI